MKTFLGKDFLLHNETAKTLFHDYAEAMPIYDYHCHLSPKEIAEDKTYASITEVWLGGDHYKWRAMRSHGIEEKYITGDGSDKEKFMKWAETIQYAIGNPLYHWAHLELYRYFGIDKPLTTETAEAIYDICNKKLQEDGFSAKGLIKNSHVKVICTTDDPIDDLGYHKMIKADKDFDVTVLPTFRPDKCVDIEKDTFLTWIEQLGKVAGYGIKNMEALLKALEERMDYFHQVGCRLADHGFGSVIYEEATIDEVDVVFKKRLAHGSISREEAVKYGSYLLTFFGQHYAKRDWAMQLHMGCMRNNNSRMMSLIGPDTGFDAVGDYKIGEGLAKLLDSLEKTHELPKTILYNLNPRDNYVLATLMGCFQSADAKGKIQFGSGWWFIDQKEGMIRQMTDLGNLGMLSNFIGMLTDSRSFLSYTRHEYFRRIMCNLIGTWVEDGEYPADMQRLGEIVQNISFNNARHYFDIEC
ncbi:glucuronate isomerase [Vallitalea pronyensis]|uniref:Uronate isomerase n=1 Tax=Vallitalea pronyensis TaxID=1348613 RepID=A0A8J8MPF3_9FIRM|nr:glucuronate isomerase [Vallitalea pronyensis]QUI25682.1 glucuronate isomerase [Vallitalea pronyensis]